MAKMVQVSQGALREIEQAIVAALISGRDEHGNQVVLETIDPKLLHGIALSAVGSASGMVVWEHGTIIEVGADEHVGWLKRVYPR